MANGTLLGISVVVCGAFAAAVSMGCVAEEPPRPPMRDGIPVGGVVASTGGADDSIGGGAASGLGECDLDFGSRDCNYCVDRSCLSSCRALADAAGVDDWIACTNDCSTDACVLNCSSTCPSCRKLFDKLSDCLDSSCASHCGSDSDAPCDFQAATTVCDECMNQACLTSCAWFSSSVGADSLLACANACQDQPCLRACASAYPDAAEAYDALTQCLMLQCAGPCS